EAGSGRGAQARQGQQVAGGRCARTQPYAVLHADASLRALSPWRAPRARKCGGSARRCYDGRMRVRARITALVLSSAVAGAVLAAHPLEASAFQGTVVDGDTEEPLEGAVVVVVWYRTALVALDSATVVHRAIERLTDSRGAFSADDSTPLLSFGFKRREAMIFKPGYQTLTSL